MYVPTGWCEHCGSPLVNGCVLLKQTVAPMENARQMGEPLPAVGLGRPNAGSVAVEVAEPLAELGIWEMRECIVVYFLVPRRQVVPPGQRRGPNP